MDINRNLLVHTRHRLQTTSDPPTGNKSSLQESDRQLGTLTGLTLLASTPCNWHSHWFHNRVDYLLTTPFNTLLTGTSFDGTIHNSILTTTRFSISLYNKDGTSSVILLQITNSHLKLLAPNECSSRNTGCILPTNQRLRRHYSFI